MTTTRPAPRRRRRLLLRLALVVAAAGIAALALADPVRDAWLAYRFVSALESGSEPAPDPHPDRAPPSPSPSSPGSDAGARSSPPASPSSPVPAPALAPSPPSVVLETPAGRGRFYRPRALDGPVPGVVLVHGASTDGPDDPRLRALARALANVGFAVLTPELAEVRNLTVTTASTEQVIAAFEDLAARPGVDPARVGIAGVSLSCGPVLVAAGDPRIAPRVRFAVSFGGYGDLRRLVRGGGLGHVFGRQLVALRYADDLVPEPERAGFRRAAVAIVREQPRDAATEATLGPSTRALLDFLAGAETGDLSARFAALVAADEEGLAAVSPEARPGELRCPVFVLHGARDPLIPAAEAERLAASLARRTDVRILVTELYGHADRAEVDSRATWAVEAFRLFLFAFQLVRAI